MKYVRICEDAEGYSRFDEVEVAFARGDFSPPGPPLDVSADMPADGAVLIRVPAGWERDWHPAPRRQLMVFLAGIIEVETSNGETRRFGAGSVVLVEDTTGHGHRSRVVGDEPVLAAVVRIPE